MYRNTWKKDEVVYSDGFVEIVCELGEYAYMHLNFSNKHLWRNRHRIFNLSLMRLRHKGYKVVFCLIPLTNPLAKERKGVSRIERELNFQRLSKSKDYLYLMRKTNA